jgi:hypothetical protein
MCQVRYLRSQILPKPKKFEPVLPQEVELGLKMVFKSICFDTHIIGRKHPEGQMRNRELPPFLV